MEDIELIREASDILILNGHDGLANKLRALAARMEAAEGFEIKRNDAGQVYLDLPYAAWMMDNIGAKLYLHPAHDEGIAVQVECGKLKDEVEMLKAERDQYKEDFRITCDAAIAANNQITAIRAAVEKAEQQPIQGTHYGSAVLVREIKAILNTINQPQCNCKNEHETVCDICAGGKEDSQPAQEQGGKE